MEKSAVITPERNREKSKQRFLDAVGKILKTKGYAALKVNDIAATAGLDKKLIYKYFGGTEQLLDAYISSQDFWSNVKGEKVPQVINDGGKNFLTDMFLEQFDYVYTNKEFQKVLLWRLSQQRNSLKKLAEDQEANGEIILQNIIDPFFGEKSEDLRAVAAILVAGIYYLNLSTTYNGNIFCGLDIKSDHGREKIKHAISFIVDQTYENL
ncbi:TetR/AcrR family transcriptional regulator [Pedobacter ureilyticus]|jgi:AcrR family transcriptional regulator|uniref:TetR/AcrR family transcriptional regulator n=1 Tax=Pedobacter ureilyticus TaxID=1393051 RepID=A0ABW9J0P7_9SPHI|nr:TetR/AcrR family transcriptional regulator [Pedobacter helvus]